MKKAVCILVLVLAIVATPAYSQVRFNAALAAGLLMGEMRINVTPVAGIHYQIPIDAFRLFAGVRVLPIGFGITCIPNVVAEYSLGPVILEGQLGGGLLFSLNPEEGINVEAGAVLLPDISVWYPADKAKALRFGGGFVGFLNFSSSKHMVAPYLGVKLVVMTH